jgi:hypothetical protein
MPNLSDATYAYRAYRRQALSTLFRGFESRSAADLIFQPEGAEDLSICDAANHLIEVVQVTSHGSSLTPSDVKPEQEGQMPRQTLRADWANHANTSVTSGHDARSPSSGLGGARHAQVVGTAAPRI